MIEGSQRGFTLIEMMLVIAISAVAFSMVIMAMPSHSRDQEAQRQLAQLASSTAFMREHAIMQGRIFGLLIEANSYMFLTLDTAPVSEPRNVDRWQPYVSKRFATADTFDSELTLTLTLSGLLLEEPGHVIEGGDYHPQVLLLPGGEVTPFELALTEGSNVVRLLRVAEDGTISSTGAK